METTISHLLQLVYSSYEDTSKWRDFCGALSLRYGNAYIAMHGHDAETGDTLGFLNTNYSSHYLEQYKRHFSALNPWAANFDNVPAGTVQASEEIMRFEDVVRTEFYNDWILPQENIATGAGVTLLKDENRLFRLSCNIRLQDRDRHQADLVETLVTLTPHIRRSLIISRQFAGVPLSEETETALNMVDFAIFLLSADGKVVFYNRAAASLLSASRSITLSSTGEIVLDDLWASRKILQLAMNPAQPSDVAESRFEIHFGPEEDALVAHFVPFNLAGSKTHGFLDVIYQSAPLSMLRIERPKRAIRSVLQSDFKLTSAEIALSMHLLEGHSLNHIATLRGTSVNTLKVQLKSVFEKLAVSRQAELVLFLTKIDK